MSPVDKYVARSTSSTSYPGESQSMVPKSSDHLKGAEAAQHAADAPGVVLGLTLDSSGQVDLITNTSTAHDGGLENGTSAAESVVGGARATTEPHPTPQSTVVDLFDLERRASVHSSSHDNSELCCPMADLDGLQAEILHGAPLMLPQAGPPVLGAQCLSAEEWLERYRAEANHGPAKSEQLADSCKMSGASALR